MRLSFTAKSEPECKSFLEIRMPDEEYQLINDFIENHPSISEDELEKCHIKYRGSETLYKDYTDEYTAFSESMAFVDFRKPMLIIDKNINAAAYFTQKAIECLQFARFFTMKSALLLDTNYNINWSQGYVPQFLFRCIYFGTATTWYSNAFDHVLQSIYWSKELYTSVVDRNDCPYDSSWDTKKIIENCTYEFVVGELKRRGLSECRKHLTKCSSQIEEVRKWANYIKHKGGIDYKYLEAEPPMQVFFMPVTEEIDKKAMPTLPDPKFEIKEFKSPIEVDIDDKQKALVDAHAAIFKSINDTIEDIDYESNSVKFGGTN